MTDDPEELARQIDEAPVVPTAEESVGAVPQGPRQPSEFAGSDTAELINSMVGGLTGEADLTARLKVGEAACAVLETHGVDSKVPPIAWLGVALTVVVGVAIWKRQKQAQEQRAAQAFTETTQEGPPYGPTA